MAEKLGTGTHERFETYADEVVKLMQPQLVVRKLFGKDYEGNPVGGAVNVPKRALNPKVSAYNILNGVPLTQSATTYEKILVDKDYAINELVDGYEASAIPDNIKAQRLEAGAYAMGLQLEQNAIAEILKGTEETDKVASTEENAYKNVLNSIKECTKLGIAKADLNVVISNDMEVKLLLDKRFAAAGANLPEKLVEEGVVSRINGTNVYTSSLLGENVEYVVFGTPWAQAVDAFKVAPKFVDINDDKHVGASKLAGRSVYTEKLLDTRAARIKKSGV